MLGAVRSAACAIVLVLGGCLVSLAPVAAADSLLVPSAGDLGAARLHPIAASTRTVTAALEAGLPRSLKQAVARGPAGVVAGVRGDEHLDAAAFVLGSQTIAHHVLTAWRRAHHGAGLALGSDGAVQTTRLGRGQRFTLAWREGARVGAVRWFHAAGSDDAAGRRTGPDRRRAAARRPAPHRL